MSLIKLEPISTVKIEKSVHLFTWRLINFSKVCPEDATEFPRFWSPEFSAGERNGRKLFWRSDIVGKNANLACYLSLLPSNWTDVTNKDKDNLADTGNENTESEFVECSYKIGLGNSKNNFLEGDFEVDPDRVRKFTEANAYWGWRRFIAISNLYKRRAELLEDDTLRVTTQLTIMHSDNRPTLPMDHLTHFLSSTFLSKKFSDLKIKCDDETFHCHKVIVAGRSSVFSRMLDSELREAADGQIDIEDMKPVAVKTMLKFIYTGTVDLPPDCSWTELIHGAEKYDLDDLKQFCFEKMFEEATIGNVGAIMVTADTYNAHPKFKGVIKAYCRTHMVKLMENSNFRNALFNHPTAFYEDFEREVTSCDHGLL